MEKRVTFRSENNDTVHRFDDVYDAHKDVRYGQADGDVKNWQYSSNEHISATLENLLSLHSTNDSLWTARADSDDNAHPALFNDTGQQTWFSSANITNFKDVTQHSFLEPWLFEPNSGNSTSFANTTIFRSLNTTFTAVPGTVSTPPLNTWSDVWLGRPFPSGYTQLAIVILAIFLSCIMILIVVGNLLVCIAIATEKSLKPVQNWFIASLAVSDLLIGLVIMPFSLARELMGYWMFGQVWCDVHAALDVFLCTASINNLFLISLDRYWSITQAVKYLKKRTPSRTAFMIAFVWIFSALVALPPLFAWKKAGTSEVLPQCNLSEDISYVIYSSVGSFYFPALMMVFVYIRIFIAARSRARRHIEKKKMLRIQIQNNNRQSTKECQISQSQQTPPSSESGKQTSIMPSVVDRVDRITSLNGQHHKQSSLESSGKEKSTSTTNFTAFSNPDNNGCGNGFEAPRHSTHNSSVGDVQSQACVGNASSPIPEVQIAGTETDNGFLDDASEFVPGDINSNTLSPQPKSPPPPQIVIEPSPESRRQSWNIISTSELISTINISSRDLTPEQVKSAERLQQAMIANEPDGADEPLLGSHTNNNDDLSDRNKNGKMYQQCNRTSDPRCDSDCELTHTSSAASAIRTDKNDNGANSSNNNNSASASPTTGRVYFLKNVSRAAAVAFPFRKPRLNGQSAQFNGGNDATNYNNKNKKQTTIQQRRQQQNRCQQTPRKAMTVDEDSDTADSPTSKEQQHNYETKSFLTAPAKLLRSKFGSSMSIADYEDSDVMEDQDSGSRKSKTGSGKCHNTGSGKQNQFGEHHSATLHQPNDADRHKRKIAKARERRATLIVGIIMAAFITAWLPFFVLYVLAAVCMVCKDTIPESVFSVAFWAGYCNSVANPIIYTIFNRDYRRAFRKILFK